ncbi:MAG: SOS response-associated peptidase [Gammaproteobacteria bacterium]|nr:SOS response-associated peptidase [Gammaproteobacteria bacterium]
MCGRFALTTDPERLITLFEVQQVPELKPHYNIAPGQNIAAVRVSDEGQREMVLLRWGLIPSWSKDPRIGARMINARAETVAGKPAFRSAFKRRRCLVPADGFYEWAKQGKVKRPYYIARRDKEPFAIAGLWETWAVGAHEPIQSCALVTTDANSSISKLHDRMPVILKPTDYATWLDPEHCDTDQLRSLLRPLTGISLTAYPVSTRVNSPRNDDAECIAAIPAG